MSLLVALAPPVQCRVLVVGAGPAGIGCAKHLKHFGYQVTVLEAKAAAGGRCYDDSSLGATLSLGAMIVTGIDNNPITTLCHQVCVCVCVCVLCSSPACGMYMYVHTYVHTCLCHVSNLPSRLTHFLSQMGFPLHLIVDDKCDLISENGTKPSSEMDKKVDDHFNTCLDRLAEWRSKEEEDCSLEGAPFYTAHISSHTRTHVHTHTHTHTHTCTHTTHTHTHTPGDIRSF